MAALVTQVIGHLAPGQVSPLMIGAMLAQWRHKYRPSTVHCYTVHARQFFVALRAHGCPPLKINLPARPQSRSVVATSDELARLLASPPPAMRLFILLYLQCGLRKSEALRITPRTWDPQNHTVAVKVKGGSIRIAEVTTDVEKLFDAAENADPDKPYIQALWGKPIGPHGVFKSWQKHRDACHVNPAVTTHDLRRTAVKILYDITHDLRVPQQLLGHKNLSSTLHYLAPLVPGEARRYAELLRFDKYHSEVKQ